MNLSDTQPDQQVRQQLLKLSSNLNWLAKADSNPIGTLLIKARSKLDQITPGNSAPDEFNCITAAELPTTRFDMTCLVEGVLVKDQPPGLVGSAN